MQSNRISRCMYPYSRRRTLQLCQWLSSHIPKIPILTGLHMKNIKGYRMRKKKSMVIQIDLRLRIMGGSVTPKLTSTTTDLRHRLSKRTIGRSGWTMTMIIPIDSRSLPSKEGIHDVVKPVSRGRVLIRGCGRSLVRIVSKSPYIRTWRTRSEMWRVEVSWGKFSNSRKERSSFSGTSLISK